MNIFLLDVVVSLVSVPVWQRSVLLDETAEPFLHNQSLMSALFVMQNILIRPTQGVKKKTIPFDSFNFVFYPFDFFLF